MNRVGQVPGTFGSARHLIGGYMSQRLNVQIISIIISIIKLLRVQELLAVGEVLG
ncbi:MAG: hypothetical protein ACUVV0_07105 [Anaerolineae bacterium]